MRPGEVCVAATKSKFTPTWLVLFHTTYQGDRVRRRKRKAVVAIFRQDAEACQCAHQPVQRWLVRAGGPASSAALFGPPAR
jgi:hypothetical protein